MSEVYLCLRVVARGEGMGLTLFSKGGGLLVGGSVLEWFLLRAVSFLSRLGCGVPLIRFVSRLVLPW